MSVRLASGRLNTFLVLQQDIPPLPGHPRALDPEANPALVGAEPAMYAFQAERMDLAQRQALLEKLMGPVGQDQQDLLQAIRSRLDRSGSLLQV